LAAIDIAGGGSLKSGKFSFEWKWTVVRLPEDCGLSTAQEAMAQAEALNFPLIVPFASTILGLILLIRRDFVACAALSSRQLEFFAEHGLVFWSAAHQVLRGAPLSAIDRGM
jgi:hypothetical protein